MVAVFCWRCGTRLVRSMTGLYRPCHTCGSTDVPIPSIDVATIGTADVAAAVERHRSLTVASR